MGSTKKLILACVCLLLWSESSYGSRVSSARSLLHGDPAAEGADPAAGGAAPAGGIINLVDNCGAKENSDVTPQLLKGFTDACAFPTPSTLVVPAGVFQVGVIRMEGPCKAPLTFQLDGTLKADPDPAKFPDRECIRFDSVDCLTITGTGIIDGSGAKCWAESGCKKSASCPKMPYNIRFDKLNNSHISGITSQDSKNFHVNLHQCKNVTIEKFKVVAPADSVNTDGIHMSTSSDIKILDTDLQTGDDCVSIGDGICNVEITKVKCGPGHGLSIGSLGKYEDEQPLSGIKVKECTLTNSDNGCRLKSWPGMFKNTVTDVLFDGITMENVSNPIILDQCYCPHGKCKASEPTCVKMSKIVFSNIKGSSANPEAVQINCSPNMCEDIQLCNIDLTCGGPDKENFSTTCNNIKPKITPPLNPPGPTCC